MMATADLYEPGDVLEIRALRPDEADAVAVLERQIFPEEAWSAGMLTEEISSPWSDYLGAFVDDELVAYGGIKGDLEGDLMTLGVAFANRGAGIGSRLLNELLNRARHRGMRQIYLEVRASNDSARALYRKVGFQEVGRILRYYQQPTEDAVTMKLEWI